MENEFVLLGRIAKALEGIHAELKTMNSEKQ